MKEKELDTEQKIKEAARKIFQEKGFAATKTRDIAEEAGINLALLNYYFRSKQKLYDIIMLEAIHSFFGTVLIVMNDDKTTIHEKLEMFVEKYIDIISKNTDIPFFIMNEARLNPAAFSKKLDIKGKMSKTKFIQQFQKERKAGNLPTIDPIHLLFNLASLVVFPFIVNPLMQATLSYTKTEFDQIMLERKKLIPIWIDAILKIK